MSEMGQLPTLVTILQEGALSLKMLETQEVWSLEVYLRQDSKSLAPTQQ